MVFGKEVTFEITFELLVTSKMLYVLKLKKKKQGNSIIAYREKC